MPDGNSDGVWVGGGNNGYGVCVSVAVGVIMGVIVGAGVAFAAGVGQGVGEGGTWVGLDVCAD